MRKISLTSFFNDQEDLIQDLSLYNHDKKPIFIADHVRSHARDEYSNTMGQVNGTQLKQGLYKQNGEPYDYVTGLSEAHQRALETACNER